MSTIAQPEAVGARATSRTRTRANVWTGSGLIALGLGMAATSLLGPLVAGAIHYRVSATILDQTIGLDAVSLALVAPLCVIVGVLELRGHAAAHVFGLGPALYCAYMFPQYIIGPEHLRLPGNNERFFPLYLALFVLSAALAIRAWSAIESERLPVWSRRRVRLTGGGLLPLAALLVFSRYLPALSDAMRSKPTNVDYLAGPTFFWTIALLDLGIGLPATVAACLGLLRGTSWSIKATYAVVGWLGLIGPAVAGMAIAMEVRHAASSSAGGVVTLTVLAVALIALAAFVYAPLVSGRTSARRPA